MHQRQQHEAQRELDREQRLRQELTTMRAAIRAFREQNGRYPKSLAELVPTHLAAVPVDPFTGTASSWRVTTEEVVGPREDFTGTTAQTITYVVDVHSGAGAPQSDY